jgi:pSer/pThr/pTyr-binding forkhead associated (FHA) protein
MRGGQKCFTALLLAICTIILALALQASADAIQIEIWHDTVWLRPDCAPGGQAQALGGSQVLDRPAALATDGLGRARLLLADQTAVTAFHDSCLEVRPAGGLHLIRGTLLVEAEGVNVVVTAPDVLVEVTGQVLVYRNPRQNVVWVVVKRGAGRVQAAGWEAILTAGQQTWVEPGQAPAEPADASRAEIGGRFQLLDDLTNGILTDAEWLPGRGAPLWLLIALAAVAVAGAGAWLIGLRRLVSRPAAEEAVRRPAPRPPAKEAIHRPAAPVAEAVRPPPPQPPAAEVGLRPILADGLGEFMPLRGGALTIGRLPGNDVQLRDTHVSGRHARITRGADGCAVEDLGSRNGTYVNDRRVTRQVLVEGDVVRFARSAFVFGTSGARPAGPRLQAPAPPPQPIQEPGRPAFPAAGLRVLQPDGQGRFVPLRQERLRIGRNPDNDLILPDPLVSGQHATLVRREDGYFIEDLQSTNGTFVNGQKITRQRLSGGEHIRAGQTGLRFEL